MSNLTPIECELQQGHPPIISAGYHLTEQEEHFLERKFEALANAGICVPAKNPTYGSPVFVVPKKFNFPDGFHDLPAIEQAQFKEENILSLFRMVVNMVKLNKYTVPTTLSLPHLERQFQALRGSTVYCGLDILSGFDFMPTHKDSQKYFTLVTRRIAWTLLGAPMGWKNTSVYFAERVINEVIDSPSDKIFNTPTNGAMCWLDDILIYAQNVSKLQDILKRIFKRALLNKV
eukprot:snap_masked-scaffold_45-processed-gene-1.24-mRNA-1 protein AED:1.00 eAED:1.00 QI:0/-1/0/0/-1/1/1/0/231